MKRSMEVSEKIVEHYILARGQILQRIPREETKTPDFRIDLNGEVVIIEVKEKQDDPKKQLAINEKLEHQSEVASSQTIKYANSIAGKLEDAAFQLEAYEAPNCIRIAWINFTGSSAEVDSKLLFKTLFGGQELITNSAGRDLYCYFYNESSFYKHKSKLDAVIESCVRDGYLYAELHLNPLSSRNTLALNSQILRALGFAPRNQIDETNPKVVVLDCDIPRRNTQAKAFYLREKYGLQQLEEFNQGVISVTMQFKISDFLSDEEQR